MRRYNVLSNSNYKSDELNHYRIGNVRIGTYVSQIETVEIRAKIQSRNLKGKHTREQNTKIRLKRIVSVL
jgi:hypothetical protein